MTDKTEKPLNQKCKFCGRDTLGSDVCWECLEKGKKESCEKTVEPQPEQEKKEQAKACEVGETFQYEGDRLFNGRLQVTALSFPCSRYTKLSFSCPKLKIGDSRCDVCNLNDEITILFGQEESKASLKKAIKEALASAFATYFDTNNPRDALAVIVEHGAAMNCPAWKHATFSGSSERAVTLAVVMDQTATEARAWFTHSEECDLKCCPNWILALGWLCRGQKGRIGILVKSFQHESEVTAPDQKDMENARLYLQQITTTDEPTLFKTARALRKKGNLKGQESVRGYEADLLNASAPIWTKTPEGPPVLSMTSCELGPTTAAKSLRQRIFIEWLGVGKYATGRQSHAGITAGIDKIEGMGFVVRKGLLPSADLSFLILDNMPPHDLDDQIESRRNGVISVSMIQSCELLARTRLKLLGNPLIPFESTLQKCVALHVYDPKLIARFAFAILTYGVDAEERYDPKIETLTEAEEKLLQSIRTMIRWNLSQEATFEVPCTLWPLIVDLSKELESKFGNEEIPLFLRANPHKISTLAYCFALLEGTDPIERHVQQAYDWLLKCGLDMELDEFTTLWKAENHLKESEYETLKKKIETKIKDEIESNGGEVKDTTYFKFFEHVGKYQKAQMEEVAAALDVADKTVKRRARDLKGLGLIKSGMSGYFLTPKGVKFLKRWLIDVEKESAKQQRFPSNYVPSDPKDLGKRVKDYNFILPTIPEENSKTENNPLYPKSKVIKDSEVTNNRLTAKDCANFHKPSCEHPNPGCLLPTNPCPSTCRGFKPLGSNHGPERDVSEDYPESGSAEDFSHADF